MVTHGANAPPEPDGIHIEIREFLPAISETPATSSKTPSFLSSDSAKELERLCEEEGKEVKELLQLGLAFTQLYFKEKKRGNAVVIVAPDGVALKQIGVA